MPETVPSAPQGSAFGRVFLWHPRGVLCELPLSTDVNIDLFYKRAFDGVEQALSCGFLLTPPQNNPQQVVATAASSKEKARTQDDWNRHIIDKLGGCGNAAEINELVDGLRGEVPEQFKREVWKLIVAECTEAGFKLDKNNKFYKG